MHLLWKRISEGGRCRTVVAAAAAAAAAAALAGALRLVGTATEALLAARKVVDAALQVDRKKRRQRAVV